MRTETHSHIRAKTKTTSRSKTEDGRNHSAARAVPRRQIALERIYDASLADLWRLWTTKDGIEAWWGPAGFCVRVHKLELRPGGELLHAMTAVGAEQIQFMLRAGLPLTTEARVTYTEVVPRRRLVYEQLADFVPGVAPYVVRTSVELQPSPPGVKMILVFDAMHDEEWTNMSVQGRESELDRLAEALAKGV